MNNEEMDRTIIELEKQNIEMKQMQDKIPELRTILQLQIDINQKLIDYYYSEIKPEMNSFT